MKVCVLLFCIIIASCGMNPPSRIDVASAPTVGAESSVEVGGTVVVSSQGVFEDYLVIKEDVNFYEGGMEFMISPGEHRVYYNRNTREYSGWGNGTIRSDEARIRASNTNYVFKDQSCSAAYSISLGRAPEASSPLGRVVENISEGFSPSGRSEDQSPTSFRGAIDIEESEICSIDKRLARLSVGGFSRQLVYLGNSGSTLYFTYREYTDNIARPAFTNDLSYDIEKDSVIGFRGARIEVLEATNSNIRYIVHRHMD